MKVETLRDEDVLFLTMKVMFVKNEEHIRLYGFFSIQIENQEQKKNKCRLKKSLFVT